jgi:hypothetical protein
MNHNVTQPEEIDIVLMQLEESDMNAEQLVRDKRHFNGACKKSWHAGYVPPYRAAFIREGI